MKRRIVCGISIISLLSMSVIGQAANRLQSTGVLLTKNASVRAAGMGEVQTAVATDESGAISWNPAGLQGIRLPEVFAAYSSGIMDDSFGTINFAMPLQDRLTGGFSLMYYDAGLFDWTTETGETRTVSAQRDMLAAATMAYQMEGKEYPMTVGANFKLMNSTLLGQYTAYAAALDLGMTMTAPKLLENLQVGFALRNLGAPMKYVETADPLPTLALAGAGYQMRMNDSVAVVLGSDLQFDLDSTWRAGLGGEIMINQLIAIRLGYKFGYDLEAMTLGMGFKMANIQVDYSFSPMSAMNSLHRVSVKYSFLPAPPAAKKSEEPSAADTSAGNLDKEASAAAANAKPKINTEKVMAEILEIQRSGGRVAKVILNIGSEQRIKVGYQGTILDAKQRPLAGIVIRQVDPKMSLAEVIGLSQDFHQDVKAVVERPIGK